MCVCVCVCVCVCEIVEVLVIIAAISNHGVLHLFKRLMRGTCEGMAHSDQLATSTRISSDPTGT